MPPVPDNPKSWEDHLLQVCRTRLSLALANEKKEFEADISRHSIISKELRLKMIDQLKRLGDLLSNPDVPPRKDPHPVSVFLKLFRQEVSKAIGEKLD